MPQKKQAAGGADRHTEPLPPPTNGAAQHGRTDRRIHRNRHGWPERLSQHLLLSRPRIATRTGGGQRPVEIGARQHRPAPAQQHQRPAPTACGGSARTREATPNASTGDNHPTASATSASSPSR